MPHGVRREYAWSTEWRCRSCPVRASWCPTTDSECLRHFCAGSDRGSLRSISQAAGVTTPAAIDEYIDAHYDSLSTDGDRRTNRSGYAIRRGSVHY
jgi:hypothetical protein